MKKKTKIWLGVGAFVVMGSSGPVAAHDSVSGIALTHALSATDVSAAKKHQHGNEQAAKTKKQGGEAGERGGEKGVQNLPPDLDFALKIAQIRGHLLVGNELVKQNEWAGALPHFLHPGEELYGPIRGRLKDYNTPPFASALKLLATAVKAKKGGVL